MSKLAIDLGLFDPLQKRLLDGLPAYGSCAGMIMLATEVLDGRPDQRCLGALDITVGQYFLPSGRNLGGDGVDPDVKAEDDPDTEPDEALRTAVREAT